MCNLVDQPSDISKDAAEAWDNGTKPGGVEVWQTPSGPLALRVSPLPSEEPADAQR